MTTKNETTFCIDCKHFSYPSGSGGARCDAGPLDLVYGRPTEDCQTYRQPEGPCGPEGKMFVRSLVNRRPGGITYLLHDGMVVRK